LPTSHDLRAKLMPDVRVHTQARNLKSTLKSAYKLVRENSNKSHVTNTTYFDRKAKERNFEVDDIVYLLSPAKKPGWSSKIWTPWAGPYKVVAHLSKLNYRIVNLQG